MVRDCRKNLPAAFFITTALLHLLPSLDIQSILLENAAVFLISNLVSLLQGVIFSIFYHAGLQRICSVSDDRSIIMYQLHFPASTMRTPSDSASIVMDWNRVTIEPMLTLFGHSGRVWDVVLLSELFISVGEVSWNCFQRMHIGFPILN